MPGRDQSRVSGGLIKEHDSVTKIRGKVIRHVEDRTSPCCELLRCCGLHHVFKLLKKLLQKGFKSIKGILSQLWFNASTYFMLNPPVVLFVINVIIFAVVLTFISLYIKVVKVTESGEEWKGFLQSFSKLELCVVPFDLNSTLSTTTTRNSRPQKSMSFGTHSIPVSLSISPTSEFALIPQHFFHLSTSMYGRHIGLEGEHSEASINVTLSFRREWNASSCDGLKLVHCQFADVRGCISFYAPKSIFPENKHLEHCPKGPKGTASADRSSYYYAGLNWQVPHVNPLYYCRSRSTLKVAFEGFFSVSKSEKVIEPSTRFHLLATSFFLAFFSVSVIVYAATFNHAAQRYHRRISVSSSSETDS